MSTIQAEKQQNSSNLHQNPISFRDQFIEINESHQENKDMDQKNVR